MSTPANIAKWVNRNLSAETKTRIGVTDEQIHQWCNGNKQAITIEQARTIGYLLHFDGTAISEKGSNRGVFGRIESSDMTTSFFDGHFGHIGLRYRGIGVMWYPVSENTVDVVRTIIEEEDFPRDYFKFQTQDNRIVFVNRQMVDEYIELPEAAEWSVDSEWDPNAPYTLIGSLEYFRALTAIDLQEDQYLVDFYDQECAEYAYPNTIHNLDMVRVIRESGTDEVMFEGESAEDFSEFTSGEFLKLPTPDDFGKRYVRVESLASIEVPRALFERTSQLIVP